LGWEVDIREPQELIDVFVKKGAQTVKLEVGDYVYDEIVGFERKSYDFLDFERMLSQIDELVDNYTFPYLVVDVSLPDLIKHANNTFHRNMLPNIIGVTASLSVRGCPPIFCGGQAFMVMVMDKIVEKALDGKDRSIKRMLRTRHLDHEDVAVNVLRALGVGIGRAEDISARYNGEVRKVIETALTSPGEFTAVAGVGGGTVEKIKKSLESKAEVKKDGEQTADGKVSTNDPF